MYDDSIIQICGKGKLLTIEGWPRSLVAIGVGLVVCRRLAQRVDHGVLNCKWRRVLNSPGGLNLFW